MEKVVDQTKNNLFESVPNDILTEIVKHITCINTFGRLQCVSTQFKNIKFMNSQNILELMTSTTNKQCFLERNSVFERARICTILMKKEKDPMTTLHEILKYDVIPIHFLVSYSVDMNNVDIVETILTSDKWRVYRHTGDIIERRWKSTIISHILIEAVRKGSEKMVQLIIDYGEAYVNVEEYAAIRLAFEKEHCNMYSMLINRLFQQKQFIDRVVL